MRKTLILILMTITIFNVFGCSADDTEVISNHDNQLELQLNVGNDAIEVNGNGIYISEYASISKVEWESIDLSNTKYTDVTEFLTEVDYYVEEITSFLGREEWLNGLLTNKFMENRRIEFKFTTEEISKAYGGLTKNGDYNSKLVIAINRDDFESGWMVMTHELTHVIAPHSKSITLVEGLACYMQDKISLNNKQFKYKGELNELGKLLIDEGYGYLSDYLGSAENGKNKLYTSDYTERLAYYGFSSSYTDFLITNYGFDKYFELYQSECDENSYMTIFGISREELVEEFVRNLDPA